MFRIRMVKGYINPHCRSPSSSSLSSSLSLAPVSRRNSPVSCLWPPSYVRVSRYLFFVALNRKPHETSRCILRNHCSACSRWLGPPLLQRRLFAQNWKPESSLARQSWFNLALHSTYITSSLVRSWTCQASTTNLVSFIPILRCLGLILNPSQSSDTLWTRSVVKTKNGRLFGPAKPGISKTPLQERTWASLEPLRMARIWQCPLPRRVGISGMTL